MVQKKTHLQVNPRHLQQLQFGGNNTQVGGRLLFHSSAENNRLISTFLHLLFLLTRRHFSFEPLVDERVG